MPNSSANPAIDEEEDQQAVPPPAAPKPPVRQLNQDPNVPGGMMDGPDLQTRRAIINMRLGIAPNQASLNRIADRQRLETTPALSTGGEGMDAPDLQTRTAALKAQAGIGLSPAETTRLAARQGLEGQAAGLTPDRSISTLLEGSRLDPNGTRQEQAMAARQQAIEARRQQAEQIKADNANLENTAAGSGQLLRTDPYGKKQPIIEAETGRPLFKPTTWERGVHPQTGELVMTMRDRYGQRQFKSPPIVAPLDPTDEQMYYKMPDGTTTPAGSIDELAAHPNYNIAKTALAARTRNIKAVHQQALEPIRMLADQAKSNLEDARTQIQSMDEQIASTQKLVDDNQGTPLGDGYTSALQQLQASRAALAPRIHGKGDLATNAARARAGYILASAQAMYDTFAAQHNEIAARVKAHGGKLESDPTYQANLRGMQSAEQIIKGAQDESQQADAGAILGSTPAGAVKPSDVLQQSEPYIAAQNGVKHVGGVSIQEFARRYGNGQGPVQPGSLIKLYQRSKDLDATLSNSGTTANATLRDSMQKEKTYIDALAAQRFARLPEDQQQKVSDATRDPTWWEDIKGAGLGAFRGATNTVADVGESVARNADIGNRVIGPGYVPQSGPIRTSTPEIQEKARDFAQAAREGAAVHTASTSPQVEEKLRAGTLTGTIPEAIGGVAPFVAGGEVLGSAAKAAGLADTAIAGLTRAATAAGGAAQGGNSLRRQAIATLAPQLKDGKISQEDYNKAVGLAELAGSTIGGVAMELAPITRFAQRIGGLPAGKSFMAALLEKAAKGGSNSAMRWLSGEGGKKALANVVREGTTMAGVGFGQDLATDLAAKETFDPSRKVSIAKAGEGAAQMGVVGALMSALTHVRPGSKGQEGAADSTGEQPKAPLTPEQQAAEAEFQKKLAEDNAPAAPPPKPSTAAEAAQVFEPRLADENATVPPGNETERTIRDVNGVEKTIPVRSAPDQTGIARGLPPSKSAVESAQVFQEDASSTRAAATHEEGAQRLVDELQQVTGRPRDEILATRKTADGTSKDTGKWADELQNEIEYQKSPLTVDPERRATELRSDLKRIDQEWAQHLNKTAAEAEAASQIEGDKKAAEERFQQNSTAAKARHDSLTERRDAIEDELAKAEQLRQSPQGNDALRGQLTQEQTNAENNARKLPTEDLQARRDAIEQQLIEAERTRQSPQGGVDLKKDLAAKAEKSEAPATYLGFQEGGGTLPGFHLYNLTKDIPGHPKGSTVSADALEKAGYKLPAPPTESQPTTEKPSNAATSGEKSQENIIQHSRTSQRPAVPENVGEVRPGKSTEAGGGNRTVAIAQESETGGGVARGGGVGKSELRSSRAKVGNGAEGTPSKNEGAQPVPEAPKLTRPKDAAPVSDHVDESTPESVEGDKLNKNWTAFDKKSGTLGVPRAEMPQVKSEARGALVNFLRARDIPAKAVMVNPGDLKPTQAEFSPAKVDQARTHEGSERPILISADGHVVDGHHQWMAGLQDDPNTPMPAIKLGAPIDKVLAEMKEFPSAEQASGATKPTEPESAPPAQKRLSDRAIEALQAAKKKIEPADLMKPMTGADPVLAFNVARNAAIDLAILGVRAGRAINDVIKLAIDRFKAKFPDHTDEHLEQLESDIRAAVAAKPDNSKQAAKTVTPEKAPETTGIAHRVSESRGVEAERGEGISAKDSVEHGRELLAKGFDAEKAVADFGNTKSISSDSMAAVRAREEELSRAANKAADDHGTDSPEYKAAWDADKDWIEKIKPMQTEWHKIGQAQQGETEIDTGTFHGLRKAFFESTGKDFTPKQEADAKRIAGSVKRATDATTEAQDKLLKSIGLPNKPTEASIKSAEDTIKGVKSGTPWTPEQAKALWHVAKANYLDQGVSDFNDIRNGLAIDYGLRKSDIAAGLAAPKGARVLTDEMYAKMADQRRVTNLAKQWLTDAKYPSWINFARGVPPFFFNLATFGHGTVGMITHAGNQMFDPTAIKPYWQNFGRQFKLMGWHDKGAFHEQAMQDLVRDPNFIKAKRAGLANDPFRYQDDYQNSAVVKVFKNIGLSGNRGFDALKLFRQDRFNQRWGALPAELKTPEMAKLLADLGNHETGVVKSSVGSKAGNWILFAPKLEASRWAFLFGDPAKAAKTFVNWKAETPEARNAAMSEVKQKAYIAGTYLGALAINQGLLSAAGSDEKVNLTNPRRGDWLSFKVSGHNLGIVSPMIGTVRFLANVMHDATADRSKFEGMQSSRFQEAAKDAGQYIRGKLSPFSKVAADAAFQADFKDKPMPWSKDKISFRAANQGVTEKYGYGEYVLKNLTPIPIQEAITDVWKSQGMSKDQAKTWMDALIVAGVVGGTGARLVEDTGGEKKPAPRRSHSAQPVNH